MQDSSTAEVLRAVDMADISEPPVYDGEEPLDPEQDAYYYGGKGDSAWTTLVPSSSKADSGNCNNSDNATKKMPARSQSSSNRCCSSTELDVSTMMESPSTSTVNAAQWAAEKAYDLQAKLITIEGICAFFTHPSNQDANPRIALERIKTICRKEMER